MGAKTMPPEPPEEPRGTVGLAGLRIEGRTDGLTLFLDFVRDYANPTPLPIEVLDSFPVPVEATILGVQATVDEVVLDAVLRDRGRAEDAYEGRQESGSFAALVDRVNPGLCAASLGRLEPGRTARLRLRTGMFLEVFDGRARIAVPSVAVYPEGSLLAAASGPVPRPGPTMAASYSLALTLALTGTAAAAALSSPTHALARTHDAVVTLAEPAEMDRDVVLVLDGLPDSDGVLVRTPVGVFAAAALTPRVAAWSDALTVTLLFDTAGLAGQSLDDLGAVLAELEGTFEPEDRVRAVRIGRTTSTLVAEGQDGTSLHRLIDRLHLDLNQGDIPVGGDVAPLPALAGHLLLVTDGVSRLAEAVCACAERENRRLFVLAVGSAPNEAVLRPVARRSGGDYVALAPLEDLEPAVQRLIGALRTAPAEREAFGWRNGERDASEPATPPDPPVAVRAPDIRRPGRRGVAVAAWRADTSVRPVHELTRGTATGPERLSCRLRSLDDAGADPEDVAALLAAAILPDLPGAFRRLVADTVTAPRAGAVWLAQAERPAPSSEEVRVVVTAPMAPAGWRGVGTPAPVPPQPLPPAPPPSAVSRPIVGLVTAVLLLVGGGGLYVFRSEIAALVQVERGSVDLPLRQAQDRSRGVDEVPPGRVDGSGPSVSAFVGFAVALALTAGILSFWLRGRRRRTGMPSPRLDHDARG